MHQDQQLNNEAYIAELEAKLAELEAKLAKALQTLKEIEELCSWNDPIWRKANDALLEVNET